MVKMCMPYMFVDVDMFYKPVHHLLYQLWRAWNAKIGANYVSKGLYLVGGGLALADNVYIRNGSGSNIGAQTFKVCRPTNLLISTLGFPWEVCKKNVIVCTL